MLSCITGIIDTMRLGLATGSEFLLDDWEVKFIDNNKEIVIEE